MGVFISTGNGDCGDVGTKSTDEGRFTWMGWCGGTGGVQESVEQVR